MFYYPESITDGLNGHPTWSKKIFCVALCENVGYKPDKDTLSSIPRVKGGYLDREPEPRTDTDVPVSP